MSKNLCTYHFKFHENRTNPLITKTIKIIRLNGRKKHKFKHSLMNDIRERQKDSEMWNLILIAKYSIKFCLYNKLLLGKRKLAILHEAALSASFKMIYKSRINLIYRNIWICASYFLFNTAIFCSIFLTLVLHFL